MEKSAHWQKQMEQKEVNYLIESNIQLEKIGRMIHFG